MQKLSKFIFVLILLVTTLISTTYAQDFFNDYGKYLLSKITIANDTTKKYVKASINRLQLTLDRFETEYGHPFLTGDTVYIIDFYGMETGFQSQIIWNGEESCYYRYSFSMVHWKVVNRKLAIETDASKHIYHFKPNFKQWVMNFDTLSYSKYAKGNMVFDGSAISFTKAVKKGYHWIFTSSNSYTTDIYRDSY